MNVIDKHWSFFVPDRDEEPEDTRSLIHSDLVAPYDAESAARMAADYMWANWDGWEWMSKRETTVGVIEDGGEPQMFAITVEAVPEFIARAVPREDVAEKVIA